MKLCKKQSDPWQAPSLWIRAAARQRAENRKRLINLFVDSIALLAIGFIFGVLFVALPLIIGG